MSVTIGIASDHGGFELKSHNIQDRGARNMLNSLANALSVQNLFLESNVPDKTSGGLWLSPLVLDLISKGDQISKRICRFISNK